jgi:hypothetical protein
MILSVVYMSNLSTTATLGTPKKVSVLHRWSLCRDFPTKIDMLFGLDGFRLAIVDRWLLFRGGC